MTFPAVASFDPADLLSAMLVDLETKRSQHLAAAAECADLTARLRGVYGVAPPATGARPAGARQAGEVSRPAETVVAGDVPVINALGRILMPAASKSPADLLREVRSSLPLMTMEPSSDYSTAWRSKNRSKVMTVGTTRRYRKSPTWGRTEARHGATTR